MARLVTPARVGTVLGEHDDGGEPIDEHDLGSTHRLDEQPYSRVSSAYSRVVTVIDRVRGHLQPTDDDHRVTRLELLFDLIFVYAITNVTHLMEDHVGGEAVLEGIVTLAIVWFGWCAYTWLGNQAKADEGLLRVGDGDRHGRHVLRRHQHSVRLLGGQ